MRGQPLHNGHISLINLMLEECSNPNIVLGSIQESRTERNPFTFEERKQMIQNIYKDKINIYGVEDIPNNNELWLKTVFSNYLYKTAKDLNSDINAFGKSARSNFLTLQEFEDYNWLEHYTDSFFDVSVDVSIRSSYLLTET